VYGRIAMAVEQAPCCEWLRAEAEPIWERIFAHPFLQEVEDGTLPDEKLQFYFVQNVLYIEAALRACAEACAKAPTDESREWLINVLEFGRDELGRQRDYVDELARGEHVDWAIAPTCHHYTRHLLACAAYGETLDLLIGLLPCSWTYDLFASRLRSIVRHPVTSKWLGWFGGDEHNDLTTRYLDQTNALASEISPDRSADLRQTFLISSKYEWMFWEMAYTQEKWPV
jgi:thiaminase/transcriptional activator TenA